MNKKVFYESGIDGGLVQIPSVFFDSGEDGQEAESKETTMSTMGPVERKIEEARLALEKRLGKEVNYMAVKKANGPEYDGFAVKISPCCAPVIPFDSNLSVAEIINKVAGVFDSLPKQEYKPPKFSKSYILENTRGYAINAVSNKAVLATLCHRKVGDIALIYKVDVPNPYGDDAHASVTVTRELARQFSITEDELCSAALAYMDAHLEILTIPDVPLVSVGVKPQGWDLGAAVLFNKCALEKAARKAGGGKIYLIPSSTDQILMAPENNLILDSPAQLRELLMFVNATDTPSEMRLSDTLYIYEDGKVSVFGEVAV